MIREIVHDRIFLARRASDAAPEDKEIARDLFDTLNANSERCVGMAANMIGKNKRIIIFDNGGKYEIMYNPEIISQKGAYETEEGCLSLDGVRKTKRYKTVKVRWQTEDMSVRIKTFSGWTAQIIQHEIDHTNGILI